ncbi:hypothetical protein [Rhizobium sp. PL01]|uniref:hypothetical protein n=1 Tax=Rhizobium sp. PL01 TaxID=3085631 RepID=UPI00298158CB|nr:hypothetical protein [Rhizobium sp. PL01]MDW5317275.1 hypothetical protein [Rhizobium sp. PL01]
MATYCNITLNANIPHGPDILDKPCKVVSSYPNGSFSLPYSATVFAWPTANTVRISSPTLNIDAAWVGASGGTLSIQTGAGLTYGITNFAKM